MANFFITTPIYYVNGLPHLGHSYTSVAADVWARQMRALGENVFFSTGTDEHGQKVESAARKVDVSPQFFADMISADFKDLADQLNITYDDFIRTTEPRHKVACDAFWKRLSDKGFIYKGTYTGWYAVSDEAYYTEAETHVSDGARFASATGSAVEWMEEESYFFKLSAFGQQLSELIHCTEQDLIEPQSKKNEMLSFLYSTLVLKDISISRTNFTWGIPVPGDEKHVMYVWFDALINYLTVLGYPDTECEQFKKFWAPDIHIVGKEIVRFHAIIWIAMLMAAELPLPKKIFSHGWWTVDGKKMGKSLGNALDVRPIIKEFGADAVRYYLLREMPFGNDGDFSMETFIARYNNELANDLGNLAQRTLSFIAKNCDGMLPGISIMLEVDFDFHQKMMPLDGTVANLISALKFNEALSIIMKVVGEANSYFAHAEPWNLKNTNIDRMHTVLNMTLLALKKIARSLAPIMPETMNKLAIQLGHASVNTNDRVYPLPTPVPLFPRYKPLTAKDVSP